jgi:dihydroneopterin aldolase
VNDSIFIEGLKINTIIGVHAWEQVQSQPLIFDLELFSSLQAAGQSDVLTDTVDYKQVSDDVIEWVQASRVQLIETLAEQVCALIFERHPKVEAIGLKLNKPHAIESAQATGLKIYRQRG